MAFINNKKNEQQDKIDMLKEDYNKSDYSKKEDIAFEIAKIYDDCNFNFGNYKLARFWYLKASNIADANYRLGCFYKDGLGVILDIDMAIKYYKIAKCLGSEKADVDLKKLYSVGAVWPISFYKMDSDKPICIGESCKFLIPNGLHLLYHLEPCNYLIQENYKLDGIVDCEDVLTLLAVWNRQSVIDKRDLFNIKFKIRKKTIDMYFDKNITIEDLEKYIKNSYLARIEIGSIGDLVFHLNRVNKIDILYPLKFVEVSSKLTYEEATPSKWDSNNGFSID